MASEDNSTKMDEEIKDNHNNNEDLSNSNESNSESESENYEPSGELFRDESNQITQQSQDLFSESVMEPDMDASNANEDMNATASVSSVSDDMIMKLASQLEKITPHTETSEPNNKCEEPNKNPPKSGTELEDPSQRTIWADTTPLEPEHKEEARRSARPREDLDYKTYNEEGKIKPSNRKYKTKAEIQKELNEAKDQISRMETTIKTRSQMITSKNLKIKSLTGELQTANEQISNQTGELTKREEQISQAYRKIQEKDESLKNLESDCTQLTQQLSTEQQKNSKAPQLEKLINEENQKQIRDLNKQLQDKDNTIKSIRDSEGTLKQQLSTEKKKKNDKISSLESELRTEKQKSAALEKEKQEIKIKLDETQKDLAEALRENIGLCDIAEKKEKDLKTAQKQLKRKNEEFSDLMTKYIDLQVKTQQKNETKIEEPAPSTKTSVLITDSNGKRIKPKLPRGEGVEWLHIQNVYRAADIPRQLTNDQDARQTLNKADSITVMVGLNEVRDGKSATEALRSIETNIQPLIDTNKPIIFCEIPPVANSISDKI